MHADGRDRIDYFPLGEGALACIVEWSRERSREPYGLLLATPGRMARREGTLLWHPEHGLRRTMLTVIVDGNRHRPEHDTTSVEWDGACVVIRWRAGTATVEERLSVIVQVLRREVIVRCDDASSVKVEAALYANPLLFDELDASRGHLEARGLTSIALYGGVPFERFITAEATRIVPGEFTHRLEYISPCGAESLRALHGSLRAGHAQRHDWLEPGAPPVAPLPTLPTSSQEAMPPPSPASRQLAISRRALRAVIGREGRFNASLFQYEFEWGLDAAMVASAAALAGDADLAREILTNILTRLSNDEGMIAEAGRFRGGELSELNGNGAVLDAIHRYWLVTRDEVLVRRHWQRIVAIAEYPLREEFSHPSGLLRTRRDFWERFPWQGVGDGFELGHQVYCAVGLAAAAELASITGDVPHAERWRSASDRIRTAMLEHPTHSLVENGRFIRRRRIDGTVEHELVADASWRSEDYAPYLPTTFGDIALACEPDVTEVLPIIYGFVEPASELARATLDAVASLWMPDGGYARYNVDSDPDSPGAWPFATAMVAMAEIASGLDARAQRTIDWLLAAAGAGGSWLEYYGERRSPPLPPVGIIVWGWAQFLLLAIESMAGVRVERDRLRIRPRMTGISVSLRLGEHSVRLLIEGLERSTLDGEPCSFEVDLLLPLSRDHDVHFH